MGTLEAVVINSMLREHIRTTFFSEYQALRDQLVEILTDDDLGFQAGGENPRLGILCREIGETEHCYVESFRSFKLEFGYRNADPRLETSVSAISSWYRELDRELGKALENLSDDEIANRPIDRSDFPGWTPLPPAQLDIYREALLIFYAKVSVYLRALGKPLPQQWREWIG